VIPSGRSFYKMSGSGNDFVFIDAREEPPGPLASKASIQAVCAHGTGVGADGIVFLLPPNAAAVRMRYLNSDGSLAALCGNATLCTARLAVELGAAAMGELSIETDSGVVQARFANGQPEIDLEPPRDVTPCFAASGQAGERRIGFALVGVPHLVLLCDDVEAMDVVNRGRQLRHDPKLSHGANVNFVSRTPEGSWRVRTYERGVEAETLACGTGAVATAVLLKAWGEAGSLVRLETRSGRTLGVRLSLAGGADRPSLSGEARIVFVGKLGELPSAGAEGD
jgi:diaminopimelate epimerase